MLQLSTEELPKEPVCPRVRSAFPHTKTTVVP